MSKLINYYVDPLTQCAANSSSSNMLPFPATRGLLAQKMMTVMSTITLLQQMGIFPKEGTCRKCNDKLGGKFKSSTNNHRYWWCSECATKTYLRQNTVLENSNLRLERFVMLVYSFTERNTTYNQTRKEACLPAEGYANNGMSNETVNRWFQYFRYICNADINERHTKIGGEGKIVEMDESMFGKMKYGKGDPTKRRRTWVFAGKCRETGGIFVRICPFNKRTKKILWPIVQENVVRGTMLYTDGWRAYRKLPTLGYLHRWVDHSKYYVDPTDRTLHTNGIEGLWRVIKRWLPQSGRYNLEQYLNLFLWFHDQKMREQDTFWSLCSLISKNNSKGMWEIAQGIVPDVEGINLEEENEYDEENDNMEDEESSDEETDDEEDEMVFSCPWCHRMYDTRAEVVLHIAGCSSK